ncbi:MAG: DoxX family protein, partial [Caulobacteraceae bacterium]|nr:DoxX family protein [Caulobacteraceae bacterium]
MEKMSAWAPRILSLLRIVTALLFIEHGAMKMFHFPAAQPGVPAHLPPLFLAAAALELGGGALVLLGLLTRPVAFLLSGEMAVGYFLVHFPNSPWPAVNQGDAAVLFCWVFFYLAFAGAGPWSLD